MDVICRNWTTCFRFKGLVCYLSDLTYILVDLNFLYTPSVTEVNSAFIKSGWAVLRFRRHSRSIDTAFLVM